LVLATALGPFTLIASGESLSGLLLPNAGTPAGNPRRQRPTTLLTRAAEQLAEYLAGERTVFDLPFAPGGTPFQRDVWQALNGIPYGKTVSYAVLAGAIGRPRAARAVGQANGANPLPIFYPCHRVVASGGGVGGYGGGLELKRWLLALERRVGRLAGWPAGCGTLDRCTPTSARKAHSTSPAGWRS